MELEGKVLVIRRIHVTYHLTCDPGQRERARRVLSVHADACPVALTLKGCIAITTELRTEDS